MNKLTFFIAGIFFLFTITGCNADNENVTEVPEDVPVEEEGPKNQSDTEQTKESLFNFTNFDLDVEYAENKEYDVDYESESNELEAEIKDDISNTQVKGDEAFEVLRPIFEQLKFDKDSPNEDVVSEVTKAFDLDEEYQKFELEVKFLDGTEKEYNNGQ